MELPDGSPLVASRAAVYVVPKKRHYEGRREKLTVPFAKGFQMPGDLSIHNMPTHLNLPSRTGREQKKQRRKQREQASQEDAATGKAEPPLEDSSTDPSESKNGGHVGTQIDVEA
jgi:hypothetical protein